MRISAVLVVVALAGAGACRRNGAAPEAQNGASIDGIAADSVRGVLSLVGSEPLPVLLLSPSNGSEAVALVGPLSTTLRAVVGLELVVSGRHTGERVPGVTARGALSIEVQRFLVRAADGVPAHDGVLLRRDAVYLLRAADGVEHAVPSLPASLQRMLGARVWLAGPLTAAPSAYGIIRQPQ